MPYSRVNFSVFVTKVLELRTFLFDLYVLISIASVQTPPLEKKRKTIGERAWTLQFFLGEGASAHWLSLVAWKVNLRACNLYPDYSNSFILSNARELFLSRISSFERERNFSCRLFTSSIIREIRHFPVVVVQWRQRNVQKKRDAPAELLSVPIQPLGYCFFDVLVVVTVVAS